MLSWWIIIVILLGVAVVSGLFFGLMGNLLDLSPTLRTGSVGVVVGIAGAVLISRRRANANKQ